MLTAGVGVSRGVGCCGLVTLGKGVTDSDVKEAFAPGRAPTHEVHDAVFKFSPTLSSNEASEFGNGNFTSGVQASVSHDLGEEGCDGIVHKVGGSASNVAGDCMRAPHVKGFIAEERVVSGSMV
jgi:hypothetical protein